MRSQSACGFLVLVVLGCVLPTIFAATSNIAYGHQENELAVNDRNDLTDVDENALIAFIIKKFGCAAVRAAATACKLIRNAEINDEVLLERSGDESMDQIDMNAVDLAKKYGCRIVKLLAKACKII
ncbi:uncharacterized protein LOC130685969 [Daphnia carinata]|uniref:uncharacterized protein LOC130685969 n=1 Tax=Daphnia carinata TaxID=120202 RepID=UPI00257CDFC8|nr:uncharacterized protein LOC130685969 [Daphnia carinata]